MPKEYTVLASGKQIERSIEEATALHEYEISDAERTIPDKIGLVICPLPFVSQFDVLGKKDLASAVFLSRQKQSNFSSKLASDMVEFICKLLGQRQFPTRESKFVFLPNLFPAKFPKQTFNFAGGLHLLDQELLYKAN